MQQYDVILCWCNNLMQCYGVTHVQSDPWYSCLSFHETQRNTNIQKNKKKITFSWPLLGLRNLLLPLTLNLFNYHLNGFLKAIFSPKKFLEMPIPHFKHKKSFSRPIFIWCQNLLNIFSILVTWTSFLNKFDPSQFS